ncbi:hypothetical protein MJM45_32920, partial [Salmonella enterica subsp. enterica serovar Kentucky]|nr:hypothetical protein [Salmonella enterica subsp. enterica serovar Kentucky]
HYKFDVDAPWASLSANVHKVVLYGSGKENIEFKYMNDRGDTSSTIATPIHQDAKLRRENTKKAGKVCVLGSFNIDVSATVPWF